MHKNSLEIRKAAKKFEFTGIRKKSQNLTKVEKIRQNVFTFRISLQFDDFLTRNIRILILLRVEIFTKTC